MTNGTVNGTGLENSFGIKTSLTADYCSPYFTESLGINGGRTAYVPPHMRNAQRAASTPVIPTGYVRKLISLFNFFVDFVVEGTAGTTLAHLLHLFVVMMVVIIEVVLTTIEVPGLAMPTLWHTEV
jgi:hypothetical protein